DAGRLTLRRHRRPLVRVRRRPGRGRRAARRARGMNGDSFLDQAGPLLLADEARNNLGFGIAGLLRENPSRYPGARFWVACDAGEPVAAALRTPPFNLVLA